MCFLLVLTVLFDQKVFRLLLSLSHDFDAPVPKKRLLRKVVLQADGSCSDVVVQDDRQAEKNERVAGGLQFACQAE